MRRARALASIDSAPRRSLEAVARPVLVPAPASTPAEPADASPGAGLEGLPKRVRQASLAPQLRGEPAGPLQLDRVDPEPPPRTAEKARATMAALQAGTARGRRDADAIPSTRESGAVPLARRDRDAMPFAGRGPGGPDAEFVPLALRETREVDPTSIIRPEAGEGGPVPRARGTATPPPGAIVKPPDKEPPDKEPSREAPPGEAPEAINGLPRRKRGGDAPPSRRAGAEGSPARKSTSGGLPRRKTGEASPGDSNGRGKPAVNGAGPAGHAGDAGKAEQGKTPPAEPEGDE
jgi:hypothetical protein